MQYKALSTAAKELEDAYKVQDYGSASYIIGRINYEINTRSGETFVILASATAAI